MTAAMYALRRGGRRLVLRLTDLPAAFGRQLMTERDRWMPWSAPAFGGGVGLYFALPEEPELWLGLAALGLLLPATMWTWRRGHPAVLLVVAACLAAAGFAAAQWETAWATAPVLQRPIGPVTVSGRVADLEPDGRRWRVVLDQPVIDRLAPKETPARVRVSTWTTENLIPGATVRLRARLMPPPPPAAPGAFDFPRQAWFERLGGVGYAVSPAESVQATPAGPRQHVEARLESLRLAVGQRLREGIGGASGGVAEALVIGERGAVPERVIDAYRTSGLAHLLAISGLHMGLAGGLMFVGLRAFLALLPQVALRWNVKKAAAVCAILATAAYLALSGANVPAQRAFLMSLVVFSAILVDRSAVTLRVLAAAALVVMAWQPHALVGASFQMSFAAVTALIAAYEVLAPRLSRWRVEEGGLPAWSKALILYATGILLSTVIAGMATAPFAAFHFHRLATWGVAANLAAMPVVSGWVMPWLLVCLLLMPFGLEGVTFGPLRWGLDLVEQVAVTVASWPAALVAVPPMPTAALGGVVAAGLWLCLWRGSWRLLAVPVVAGALAVPWLGSPPDMVVSGDGAVQAVRAADGLVLSPGRGDAFTRDLWTELWGKSATEWAAALPCDPHGCLLWWPGRPRLTLAFDEDALAEDCAKSDVVVTPLSAHRRDCPAPLLINRWDLWRGGTHALWLTPEGVRVETVAGHRGRRPWSGSARRW